MVVGFTLMPESKMKKKKKIYIYVRVSGDNAEKMP